MILATLFQQQAKCRTSRLCGSDYMQYRQQGRLLYCVLDLDFTSRFSGN